MKKKFISKRLCAFEGFEGFKISLLDEYALKQEARLASECIMKWGMVAAEDDGEDSQGRAKLRLSTPREIVQRACDIAQIAMNEFKSRGWLEEIPDLIELEAVGNAKDEESI